MIQLLTGTPGAGKTAWTVAELIKLYEETPERIVYQHGIKELQLPHIPIYCTSELCDLCRSQQEIIDEKEERIKEELEAAKRIAKEKGEEFKEEDFQPLYPVRYVENWPSWVEPGSLVIIDEVQRIWRNTSSGAKLPDSIARLETHRHYGIDMWLITQGPHLMHSNVKNLISRHVHLKVNAFRRQQYEWPECHQSLENTFGASAFDYKLPKHVYGLYKSAELHTKIKLRKPKQLYIAIAALVFVFVGGYYKAQDFINRGKSKEQLAKEASVNSGANASLQANSQTPASGAVLNEKKIDPFPDFKPDVEGVPESAPAYRELIKVTSAPLLGSCVISSASNKSKEKGVKLAYEPNTCKCYTTQGTPYNATQAYCEQVVKGNRFNPYHVAAQPVFHQSSFELAQKQTEKEMPKLSNEYIE